jgi:hypothetical protein
MECDADNTVPHSEDHVIKVPRDLKAACAMVQRDDTVFLPFDLPVDPGGSMRITERNGHLLIEHGDSSVLLQNFVKTIDEHGSETLILREANGTPVDIPLWLAITDPNMDIQQ